MQLLSSCFPVAVHFEPKSLSSTILARIRSMMRWAGHVARGEMRKPSKIVAGRSEVCQEFSVRGRILLKEVLKKKGGPRWLSG